LTFANATEVCYTSQKTQFYWRNVGWNAIVGENPDFAPLLLTRAMYNNLEHPTLPYHIPIGSVIETQSGVSTVLSINKQPGQDSSSSPYGIEYDFNYLHWINTYPNLCVSPLPPSLEVCAETKIDGKSFLKQEEEGKFLGDVCV
jgi:hypothetical protein